MFNPAVPAEPWQHVARGAFFRRLRKDCPAASLPVCMLAALAEQDRAAPAECGRHVAELIGRYGELLAGAGQTAVAPATLAVAAALAAALAVPQEPPR